MLDQSQRQYLEDVLGADLRFLRTPSSAVASAPQAVLPALRVAVLAMVQSEDEKALLNKVLASVQLSQVEIFPIENEASTPSPALHVLKFSGGEGLGRQTRSDSVWWTLPSLVEMTSGPQVAEKKKQAWSLLQQFSRERAQ